MNIAIMKPRSEWLPLRAAIVWMPLRQPLLPSAGGSSGGSRAAASSMRHILLSVSSATCSNLSPSNQRLMHLFVPWSATFSSPASTSRCASPSVVPSVSSIVGAREPCNAAAAVGRGGSRSRTQRRRRRRRRLLEPGQRSDGWVAARRARRAGAKRHPAARALAV